MDKALKQTKKSNFSNLNTTDQQFYPSTHQMFSLNDFKVEKTKKMEEQPAKRVRPKTA
jgi:hypothetical protein